MKWFVPWLQKSMGIQMYWLMHQMLCLKYIKRVLFWRNYPFVYYIRAKLFLCPPHKALGSNCMFSWLSPHPCAVTVRAPVRFSHLDLRLAALAANNLTEYAWGPKLETDHYIPNRNIHSWKENLPFHTYTDLYTIQIGIGVLKMNLSSKPCLKEKQNKTITVPWPK